MAKIRKISDTEILAKWFYCEIMGKEWDYRLASRYLGEAKHLVNPPKNETAKPIPLEVVKGTVLAMQEGKYDDWTKPVTSLRFVLWGEPPYYQRYQEWLEKPPPAYLKVDVSEWEGVTGKVAYPECDIIIVRPSAPKNVPEHPSYRE